MAALHFLMLAVAVIVVNCSSLGRCIDLCIYQTIEERWWLDVGRLGVPGIKVVRWSDQRVPAFIHFLRQHNTKASCQSHSCITRLHCSPRNFLASRRGATLPRSSHRLLWTLTGWQTFSPQPESPHEWARCPWGKSLCLQSLWLQRRQKTGGLNETFVLSLMLKGCFGCGKKKIWIKLKKLKWNVISNLSQDSLLRPNNDFIHTLEEDKLWRTGPYKDQAKQL